MLTLQLVGKLLETADELTGTSDKQKRKPNLNPAHKLLRKAIPLRIET